VHADAEMIRVVMEHLLGNARKFSARVSAPRIEVGRVEVGGEVAVFVRDSGVGFDPRHAEQLFAPFQRLHAQDFPGSGIGLAVGRRIIERHGGRLWAEGRLGEGASFYFTLGDSPD